MKYKKLLALLVLVALLISCQQKDGLEQEGSSSAVEEPPEESYPITLPPSESSMLEEPVESSSIVIPEKQESKEDQAPSLQTSSQAPKNSKEPSLSQTPPASVEQPVNSRANSPGNGTQPSPQPEKSNPADGTTNVSGIDAQLFESELIRLINAEREQHGRRALALEDTMRWAARIRAAEVLDNLSHTRPDGTSYYTAFDEVGFPYAGKWHGENVSYMEFSGMAYDTASAARYMFDELRSSPGHYTNMLNENFAQIGVGVEVATDGNLVRIGSAQMFAGM